MHIFSYFFPPNPVPCLVSRVKAIMKIWWMLSMWWHRCNRHGSQHNAFQFRWQHNTKYNFGVSASLFLYLLIKTLSSLRFALSGKGTALIKFVPPDTNKQLFFWQCGMWHLSEVLVKSAHLLLSHNAMQDQLDSFSGHRLCCQSTTILQHHCRFHHIRTPLIQHVHTTAIILKFYIFSVNCFYIHLIY